MSNTEFWQHIDTIIARGYDAQGLKLLEEYAELFISGRLVYKRFSPLEQHGCAAGGSNHVIASLLAGASIDPSSLSAPEIYLSDLHDENVIKSANGNVFVIDCDIRINTPELKLGGVRDLTTEVEFI